MHKLLAPYKHRREWFEVDLKTARDALAQAMEDLAEKRRHQIAWEMQTGGWTPERPHPLASWDGRGISGYYILTDWIH